MGFGELTFVSNDEHYSLPSHHWNQFSYRSGAKDKSQGGYCHHGILELDILQPGQENLFILGDVFMQLYYSVFDRDNDQVGLAKAKHDKAESVAYFDERGQFINMVELP